MLSVPIVEHNLEVEGVKNNVFGTAKAALTLKILCSLALTAALSNHIMGAKVIEEILQALAAEDPRVNFYG